MTTFSLPMLRRAIDRAPGNRLLRLASVLMCAVAAAFALPGAALASDEDLPGRVGRIADSAGEVFLAPQDKPDEWVAVGLNYPVAGGDNLWAGKNGRAEIDFGAGQFRLASDTNIHVSRLDDREFALFVAQGRVSVRVRFLEPGETARVDTPNAQVVLTRPGLYRVDVSEDREHTQLSVREGEANVLTLGAVQQVLPGQTAAIDGTEPRYADVRNGIGTDGFDSWAASRDRRYDRGRSANYVSPQMVGAADLDRYGTWSQVPEYGAVWYPSDVGADWAPYRNGYWTEVGAWGPTWVDNAPWGYAPFHYGRWAYVGGRWGWCPGRYVARPLWAPALVGWAGGAGWSLSVSTGVPVYGWVPLAWGEPFRPWWGRCSHGCWDRYNRPYAVNVAYRTNSPPTRYVNWNAPGGISAMSGSALVMRKPVQANLVRVPGGIAASAPVLASAPVVRSEPGNTPMRRPGAGAPPPASTFYPTTARPGGIGATPSGTSAVAPSPTVRTRPTPAAGAPQGGSPLGGRMPQASSGGSPPTAVPPASYGRPAQPAPQGAAPSYGGVGTATAVNRPAPQMQAPQPNAVPQSGSIARQQARPQPAPVQSQAQGAPTPASPMVRSAPVAPTPQTQSYAAPQAPMARPQSRPQPAQPQAQGMPMPASPMRAQPAPVQAAQPQGTPMSRSAPAVPPAPVRAAPPAAASSTANDGGNMTRKSDR